MKINRLILLVALALIIAGLPMSVVSYASASPVDSSIPDSELKEE